MSWYFVPQETHSETSSDTQDGILELRPDLFSKLDEECLPVLGALLLVAESQTLVTSSGKLDQVQTSLVQLLCDLSGLFLGQSTLGKVGRVHLDRDQKLGSVDALLDLFNDPEDDSRLVFEGTSPLVVPLVDTRGKELG